VENAMSVLAILRFLS